MGIGKVQCGAVTFVQRFGGSINLNIHFHSLVLEGVYREGGDGRIRFQGLPPPTDAEVERIAGRIARRVIRLLEHRGLGPDVDQDEADPFSMEQPLLAELYTASVQGRISTGPQAGNYVATLGFQADSDRDGGKPGLRCANVSGFGLHANVCIPAKALSQLEKLCRYAARPAVAMERLSILPDGRIVPQASMVHGAQWCDSCDFQTARTDSEAGGPGSASPVQPGEVSRDICPRLRLEIADSAVRSR